MQEIKLKPKFAEVIDNPTLSREEKLLFILTDTVEHYTLKNRCTNDKNCFYNPETINIADESEGCAVGRMLEPESSKAIDEKVSPDKSGSAISGLLKSSEKFGFDFPTFFKDNPKFFNGLQYLHDTKRNWTETGLSVEGEEKVKDIKKDFNLN